MKYIRKYTEIYQNMKHIYIYIYRERERNCADIEITTAWIALTLQCLANKGKNILAKDEGSSEEKLFKLCQLHRK